MGNDDDDDDDDDYDDDDDDGDVDAELKSFLLLTNLISDAPQAARGGLDIHRRENARQVPCSLLAAFSL